MRIIVFITVLWSHANATEINCTKDSETNEAVKVHYKSQPLSLEINRGGKKEFIFSEKTICGEPANLLDCPLDETQIFDDPASYTAKSMCKSGHIVTLVYSRKNEKDLFAINCNQRDGKSISRNFTSCKRR